MATSENIVEEFDDLGFTLDNPQVIDRLVGSKLIKILVLTILSNWFSSTALYVS